MRNRREGLVAMATRGGLEFEKLSRRHGVKIPAAAGCSVEQCGLAVGAIIGYDSIKSASRTNCFARGSGMV